MMREEGGLRVRVREEDIPRVLVHYVNTMCLSTMCLNLSEGSRGMHGTES